MTNAEARRSLHELRDFAAQRVARNERRLLWRGALDPFEVASLDEDIHFWTGVRDKASAHCCIWHRILRRIRR